MFDRVASKPDVRGRARRGAFVALSAALQALVVVALVVVGDRFRAAVTGTEPIVDVRFFRPAAPPAPPAPPAAPAPRRATPPRARTERPIPPARPQALVQPKAPAPVPEPPPPEETEEPESQREGGVVGGAPGAAPASGGSPGGSGDAPTFAKPGYRLPHLAVSTCLARSLDVSSELRRSLSGAVTVKFAILGNGSPAYFQVLGDVADRRVGDAIWKAVSGCQWVPGADASGQPVSIWVVVPFKFQSS